MDKPQLLAEFKRQLEAFDKFRGFIEKAREKAHKFRPEVVEKVVRENSARIDEVVATLDPLVAEVRAVLVSLEADRAGIEAGVENARLGLEELELRREIGELDDEAFAAESAGFQSEVDAAGEMLAAVDAEIVEFRNLLDAWSERRPSAAAVPAEEDLLGDLEDEVDAFGGGEEPAFTGRGEAPHARKVEIADDVSAVFDTAADTARDDYEDEVIEAGGEEGISFGEDELAGLGDDLPARSGTTFEQPGAVLILAEGTDQEQVFPFTGDVISLGRGRDNTIQVKNDSKVSRYHCKVVRRDGAYVVEDCKSANGTLVDGELITEKRLLGGEEIIVGETFFRFRINP